jgi:hypothetical protein
MTLGINDPRAGKALEENPFLKIWATKLSAFRMTEFGSLENIRKKGCRPEFKSISEVKTVNWQ